MLDIASHDGRWSFAALQAGAAHVTGVEGRPELVEAAKETFAAKGIDPGRHTMIAGDVHDVLTAGVGEMDVVMCLGFLYHTLRYPELLTGIRATGARKVIVDCKVIPRVNRPMVRLLANPVGVQSMAVEDRYSHDGKTLVGMPSERAIEMMLGVFGFEVTSRPDWPRLIAEHPEIGRIGTYASGERVTMLATRVD